MADFDLKKFLIENKITRNSQLLGENRMGNGIDLLDYEYKEYTPEMIKQAILSNDESILPNTTERPVVDTAKFLNTIKTYIRNAGYNMPEDFLEGLEAGAYDGDTIYIFNMNDLEMFSNFTLQKVIKFITDEVNYAVENNQLEAFGLPEGTTSIEDFRN